MGGLFGTHFTCCTSTVVQILEDLEQVIDELECGGGGLFGTQFTCFTSTKVHILTPE